MISAILLSAGLSKRFKNGNKLIHKYNRKEIIIYSLKNILKSKIAEIIIDCLGSKSNIVILDKDAPFKNLMLNIDRAKNVLNFKPSNLPKSIKEYALNKNEDNNE